jgi:molecular chaperone DnaK
MATIGIDLGTTYCAASRYINGVPEIIALDGHPTLPSVVSVLPNGKIAVGKIAKNNQLKNPQDTIVEVKRKMGENVKIKLGQKEFSPQEISAMILKKIKELVEEQLGEPVTAAVITCPAYFMEPQRDATKQAGELAGLNVLKIINEPTAAAYAYGIAQLSGEKNAENIPEKSKQLFLVYDLGGGTFDVTLIKSISGNIEVIGTGGDPHLGGGNFDDRIVDWMLENIKADVPGYLDSLDEKQKSTLRIKLKSWAEEGKIKLCESNLESYAFKISAIDHFEGKPVPFTKTLTKQKFEELIMDLMENSFKWIDVAMKVPKEKYGFTEKHITEILLVGGSTRVPLVKELLRKHFPETAISGFEKGINPDEIVAVGAGIVAAQNDPDSDEIVDTVLKDVTGHTLSVLVYDESGKFYLSPLIEKETIIPKKVSHQFASSGNFTTQVQIQIFQGEGTDPKAKDVMMIGEFIMELPPVEQRIPLIIGLDLDSDAILTAHATNGITGEQVKCTINYKDSTKMSADMLKQRQGELEKQMETGVGSTANPLEKNQPQPQPQQTFRQQTTAASSSEDVKSSMNPIIRNLYEKAITNFEKIPPENQLQAMQLVSEIEGAAKAGNQVRMMELYSPLSNLLKGI